MQAQIWLEKVRRNPNDPHAWAMAHRRIGGRPLQELWPIADIARDDFPQIVVMKSAQVGLSELAVNLALHAADIGYAGRGVVFYLFPLGNQMTDFVQGRFDPAIRQSPYLLSRVVPQPPLRRGANNQRLKYLGNGYIYFRGSENPRQIASVDADLVILDEYDQMAEGVLDLALKRLASSREGRLRVFSTPRLPGAGIDELYRNSDQRKYFLACQACGLEQTLCWEENVDQERCAIVCRTCRSPLNAAGKGRWIPQAPGNDRVHGYHLSRLYSPWVKLPLMIEASRSTSVLGRQEFFNSDLGLPFVPPNGGLTLDELDRCRQDYAFSDYDGRVCAAGVDVGLVLNVVIRTQPNLRTPPGEREPSLLTFAGEVGSFDELNRLVSRYNVKECVVDGLPEGHKVREFAQSTTARVRLAYYVRRHLGHEIVPDYPDRYLLDRSLAIDEMVAAFRRQELLLPRDARQLGGRVKDGTGEYYRQLLAPQRTLERNAHGNLEAMWVEGGKRDDYAHAEVYCFRALNQQPAALVLGNAQEIFGGRRPSASDFNNPWWRWNI